jgi:hypothetical protein
MGLAQPVEERVGQADGGLVVLGRCLVGQRQLARKQRCRRARPPTRLPAGGDSAVHRDGVSSVRLEGNVGYGAPSARQGQTGLVPGPGKGNALTTPAGCTSAEGRVVTRSFIQAKAGWPAGSRVPEPAGQFH